ncbi:unnamed protein product [Rotaria sp. Silwood1]|nr:unnamed protein product [Rotaria sp. Silwood1]
MCNRRVTQVTTSFVRQLAKPIPMKVEDDHHDDEHTHISLPKTPTPKTFFSMSKFLLRGNASISTGLNTPLSIRYAHTDIQVPNFDYYRRKARLDPSKSYRDAGDATSPYSYLAPIGKSSLYWRKLRIRC